MQMLNAGLFALALTGLALSLSVTAEEGQGGNPYAAWKNGPPSDPSFFPVCVWLQAPSVAPKYKEAGINVYVGLWKGPTAEQLDELKKHGMKLICDQNELARTRLDDPTIIGWMHGDEPDNAQSLGKGKGYGPPITPEKIVEDYKAIKERDPSRPVILNLGQGVAWDNWIGRGVRTNKPEDYPEYVKGCDLVSFDIYPACHGNKEVAGKLWFVADGVKRLREWSKDEKPVWTCIECTHISNPEAKATPHQVRCEVWMALVRGAKGLIYFSHEFKPKFVEAGMLADAEMLAAITKINKQIHELAPVLNSPSVKDGASVETSNAEVPVECLVKRHGGATYLFAVGMRDGTTTASFKIAGLSGAAKATVLGEDRTVDVADGVLKDEFKPWDAHLYKIGGE